MLSQSASLVHRKDNNKLCSFFIFLVVVFGGSSVGYEHSNPFRVKVQQTRKTNKNNSTRTFFSRTQATQRLQLSGQSVCFLSRRSQVRPLPGAHLQFSCFFFQAIAIYLYESNFLKHLLYYQNKRRKGQGTTQQRNDKKKQKMC